MAKKKDEKDVLIVRDEKTGEISVVAGLQADGTPKRTPAKMENSKDFLQFDKNGDVLDNFFRNFFRQCKEPSRFGFYRIAADQAENLLGVMKELLKDPAANADLLAPHKVDTSAYEKQVAQEQKVQEDKKQEMNQNQTNNVEPQKQENMQQKQENVQQSAQENKQESKQRQGYQPIDESRIDWQALEKNWGVKRDELEQSGDLQKMLNYGKSDLVRVTPNFGGESLASPSSVTTRDSPSELGLSARCSVSSASMPASPSARTMTATCASFPISSARSRNSTSTRATSSPRKRRKP